MLALQYITTFAFSLIFILSVSRAKKPRNHLFICCRLYCIPEIIHNVALRCYPVKLLDIEIIHRILLL
jgi:hypothetical protein